MEGFVVTINPKSCVKMAISKPKSFYLMQSVFPSNLPWTARGHSQPRTIPCPNQLCGHQQNLVAQGLKRGSLKLWWQTQPLEPIDQILSLNCGMLSPGIPRIVIVYYVRWLRDSANPALA